MDDDQLSTVLQLSRLTTQIVRRIDRAISGYHGIGLNDLALLVELQGAPEHRLQRAELAERLGITPSGVARQLGPLERIGVVDRERHPSDARLALVVLTPAGDELATNTSRTAAEAAHTVLGGLWSRDDQEALAGLLAASFA